MCDGPVLRHGTRNAYERHKCRCDECRAVNASRHLKWVRQNRDQHRALSRESYHRNRDHWLDRKAEYKRDNPEKVRARTAVQAEIEAGRIVRGVCEYEGDDCSGTVQAHHEDYSKQLEVRWLCQSHHRFVHLGALV